jgi:hypothetical protein
MNHENNENHENWEIVRPTPVEPISSTGEEPTVDPVGVDPDAATHVASKEITVPEAEPENVSFLGKVNIPTEAVAPIPKLPVAPESTGAVIPAPKPNPFAEILKKLPPVLSLDQFKDQPPERKRIIIGAGAAIVVLLCAGLVFAVRGNRAPNPSAPPPSVEQPATPQTPTDPDVSATVEPTPTASGSPTTEPAGQSLPANFQPRTFYRNSVTVALGVDATGGTQEDGVSIVYRGTSGDLRYEFSTWVLDSPLASLSDADAEKTLRARAQAIYGESIQGEPIIGKTPEGFPELRLKAQRSTTSRAVETRIVLGNLRGFVIATSVPTGSEAQLGTQQRGILDSLTFQVSPSKRPS